MRHANIFFLKADQTSMVSINSFIIFVYME